MYVPTVTIIVAVTDVATTGLICDAISHAFFRSDGLERKGVQKRTVAKYGEDQTSSRVVDRGLDDDSSSLSLSDLVSLELRSFLSSSSLLLLFSVAWSEE